MICNNQKPGNHLKCLSTTEWIKKITVQSHARILYRNENKWITAACNMKECQKHECVQQKKADTKESNSICRTFKNGQNYTTVLKAKMAVTFWQEKSVVTRREPQGISRVLAYSNSGSGYWWHGYLRSNNTWGVHLCLVPLSVFL